MTTIDCTSFIAVFPTLSAMLIFDIFEVDNSKVTKMFTNLEPKKSISTFDCKQSHFIMLAGGRCSVISIYKVACKKYMYIPAAF